ncbi:MAG: DUF763 domain-containing protein [Desulfobacterales bacterium]|nr:DUF763 domain-containing protein [Desulfobacterales bacterium]
MITNGGIGATDTGTFKDPFVIKKTGIADSPLHYGKAPSWLFQRMKRLAREIIIVMVHEFGAKELLKRISDPYWFQALGSCSRRLSENAPKLSFRAEREILLH